MVFLQPRFDCFSLKSSLGFGDLFVQNLAREMGGSEDYPGNFGICLPYIMECQYIFLLNGGFKRLSRLCRGHQVFTSLMFFLDDV